ncbi:MAG: dihydroorotase family protein [Chloroflexi bacterium]|nr:dihydroorotase family protein [Chloroflexota bacterium]
MPNLAALPALVDPHVHLRGLAWAHKGDFTTETSAAVAGGYWLVCDMPNTTPATLDPVALQTKLDAVSAEAVCDWGVYFGASAADNTYTYDRVADDVCGLKMFCNETTGNLLIADPQMREKHFAAWTYGKPLVVHAEGETVAEILSLVRKYRRQTHFLHISTAFEIGLLSDAKNEGLPITVGVCPHHLWMTEDDERSLGAFGRMKPGLKSAADRDALWGGIESRVVDIVESDHAPHTREEKSSAAPPYGVPGLETTLPLLLTAVAEGRLSLNRVIELVSYAPCALWGLTPPKGTGCMVDLDAKYVFDASETQTKCKWSPFDGMTLTGRVRQTFIRGVEVYDGEQVRAQPGFGKNVWARR